MEQNYVNSSQGSVGWPLPAHFYIHQTPEKSLQGAGGESLSPRYIWVLISLGAASCGALVFCLSWFPFKTSSLSSPPLCYMDPQQSNEGKILLHLEGLQHL